MVNHHIVTTLFKDVIALFCAASLAISAPAQVNISPRAVSSQSISRNDITEMWYYLRRGINYLEASGKEVPPHFMHSGGKAYGPLALTPIAIKDVKKHYPSLSGIKTEEVLLDRSLYEAFAFMYADLLLRHYLKLDYLNMEKKDVFNILEKAWFLGPTLYLKGHFVVASREIKARRYLTL